LTVTSRRRTPDKPARRHFIRLAEAGACRGAPRDHTAGWPCSARSGAKGTARLKP